jgi:isoleucyl-tRNA synthetase
MSFTAEEVWGHMGRPESVHMAYFPEPAELAAGLDGDVRKRAANWDRLMQVRDIVLKFLDTARNEKLIGAPLEARVRLSANGELYTLLEQYADELPGLFIVSQVELDRAAGDELSVQWSAPTGMRALLEVHDGCRRRRGFPDRLRRAPRRSTRSSHEIDHG